MAQPWSPGARGGCDQDDTKVKNRNMVLYVLTHREALSNLAILIYCCNNVLTPASSTYFYFIILLLARCCAIPFTPVFTTTLGSRS